MFSGGHGDRLLDRVAVSLKFFSDVLSIPETIADCDLNIDGRCDAVDLGRRSLYRVNLDEGSTRSRDLRSFDLNADDRVDNQDLEVWLSSSAHHNGFESSFVAGDANLDGAVAFDDFVALANHFEGTDRDWGHGNFDGDRDVDFDDFLALSDNFGNTLVHRQAVAVPEPCTFFSAVLGTCLVFFFGGVPGTIWHTRARLVVQGTERNVSPT